jgi:hypothetical protein
MANDNPLDLSNTGYSDSGKGHQWRIRAQHHTDNICNDSFGDLVHSADNPRAAVSTTHCFTNERYDKCSMHSDSDGGCMC